MHQIKKQISLLLLFSMTGFSYAASAQGERFEGKPAFAEGTELGYYLWRDGDTWKLRWTTMGRMRHFNGSVTAEGGQLRSLKRIDVESERRVLYPGRAPHVVRGPRGRAVGVRGGRAPVVVEKEQDKIEKVGDDRIVFLTKTDDDIDGFDFKVDQRVKALRFVLEIDGKPMPQHVETGRNNQKVANLPLVVRLQ
jgi:hypothetical protein